MSGKPLSRCGGRVPLCALPRIRAPLPSTATIATARTAARLGTPRVPVATAFTVVAGTTISAEVAALELTTTSTPSDRYFDFLCLCTPRGEEPQCGSHEGSAAELYCLTARDCAGVQTPGQVVEGVNTSFISLHQQRNSSFPFLQEQTRSTSKTGPPLC